MDSCFKRHSSFTESHPTLHYSSKYYQEATARRFCADKVELVMVNPSLLLGPGDERIGSTRGVVSFLSGDERIVPPGGINFVDARDVAAIIPVAMEKGRAGSRYLLGGHNMSFADYFDRMERLSKEYCGKSFQAPFFFTCKERR